MSGTKPPLKEQNKTEELVDATTGTRRAGKLRYDENHVTLVDQAKQRRHITDYCRLVPDLTKAGGCKRNGKT
jgi:hypothetical protein